MRFRQMATYRGVPYEVGVGPAESDVVLFAACPPPEELGFEPATGHWRKRVIRAEVDVLWESRPIGTFHGEACLVLDDLGDRLHIVYLGKDARRARELGYWQVDRGVFELLTPRDEVTSLNEEKVEKSLPRARPEPAAPPQPSYPYGAQPWSAAPLAAPAPADARGRGYPAEPALAPAGAWTGNGAPPQWTGSGTGGHPALAGYGPPGGPDGWTGPGTGPQPPVNGYGPGTGPQPAANGYGPATGPQPPANGYGPATGPQPPANGYGPPANWTGNGAPGGWNGNSTGGHPAPAGYGPPGRPADWTGPGTGPQPPVNGYAPPANWTGNGAPPPGGWTGPGTGPQPAVSGYGPPANWTGNGAPGSWNGNGAAGMNGHGPVNGNGNGQWNGGATTMQGPPAGPNGILEGTPLAGPSRRAQPSSGRRSARKQRVQTRSIFSELADLAAIPRAAYALEQEADGAMCLLRTDEGFEVFSAADGARHEVRTFEDEEAAYFYLFGVLAAEAVRNGGLIPPR
jgi:hypothetical protein